jgi:hypothetical protein
MLHGRQTYQKFDQFCLSTNERNPLKACKIENID